MVRIPWLSAWTLGPLPASYHLFGGQSCKQAVWQPWFEDPYLLAVKTLLSLAVLVTVEKIGPNHRVNEGFKPELLPGLHSVRRPVCALSFQSVLCPSFLNSSAPRAAFLPSHNSKGRLLLASCVKEGLVLRLGPQIIIHCSL